MTIEIEEMAYHRNGVGGEPFCVVTFRHAECGEMVAVLFANDDRPEGQFANPRTAVFNRELLGQGVIAQFKNAFRGDNFDAPLRAAVNEKYAGAFR